MHYIYAIYFNILIKGQQVNHFFFLYLFHVHNSPLHADLFVEAVVATGQWIKRIIGVI